jgi:tetratricopeptide (TPR) repeat protein
MTQSELAVLLVSTLVALLSCSWQPALAQAGQWTTTQDLDPTKTSTNRPIRDKWAVVIGASKFSTSRLNTDQNFDGAARSFYNYLIDPHGGRFAKTHVKLLLNSEATFPKMVSALGDGYLSKVAEPDDLVVVFVSGRSFPTTDDDTYLCGYDVTLNNISGTCLSVKHLMNIVKDKVKSKRIVLIIEASGSGAAELSSGAKSFRATSNVDLEKLTLGEGLIVLSSSGPSEVTWGTAFSNSLIKALRENDGLTSLQGAFASAKDATEAATSIDIKKANKQTPQLRWDWKGKDLVIGAPASTSDESAALQKVLGAEAHYLKALQAIQAGDFTTGTKEFDAAIQEDPYYADAIADYGGMFAMQKRWDKAAEKYELAIQTRPDDALFHFNYANVLRKMNRPDDSFAELQKAYELNTKDCDILGSLAGAYEKREDWDKSVEYLQQAIDLAPKDAELRVRVTVPLCKKGDLEAAINHAQQSIAIDHNFARGYLTLGNLYLGSRSYDKAADAYRNGLQVAPTNPDMHLYLGKCLQQLNQETEAVAEYRKFLELCSTTDPRAEDTRNLLNDLGKI